MKENTIVKTLSHHRTLAARFIVSGLLLAGAGSAVAGVHYVDVNSTNATPPYSNWSTAATNIQDAVDAAAAGDEIVVTNGVYGTGARTVAGVANRVVVDQALDVRSVNGPEATRITGLGGLGGRCVYLGSGAKLSGFTLSGGKVNVSGGGAYGGTLNNCVLSNNRAALLDGGGGAALCTLNNCTLSGNSAYNLGGGAIFCTLNNCILSGNSAADGGGASQSFLNNCTLTGNSIGLPNSPDGRGGALNCIVKNCILFGNIGWQGRCEDCDSDPLFVHQDGGNLRLQSNSPCINAGNNSYVTSPTDLDGNPRIVGGTVDIGAYEYQSLDLINSGFVSNQFGFDITGQSNQVVIVEGSTNLLNWSPLTTNTLNGHPFPFTDPTPTTLPQRFYRAQAQ